MLTKAQQNTLFELLQVGWDHLPIPDPTTLINPRFDEESEFYFTSNLRSAVGGRHWSSIACRELPVDYGMYGYLSEPAQIYYTAGFIVCSVNQEEGELLAELILEQGAEWVDEHWPNLWTEDQRKAILYFWSLLDGLFPYNAGMFRKPFRKGLSQ
jgi:hypothetical protein